MQVSHLWLLLLLCCWACLLVYVGAANPSSDDDDDECEVFVCEDGNCGKAALKRFETEVEARNAVFSSFSCQRASHTQDGVVEVPASCSFLCKQGYRPTAEEGTVRTQCSGAIVSGTWLNVTGRCEPKYACQVSLLPQLDPDTRGWSPLSGGLTPNGTLALGDAVFTATCANTSTPQTRTAFCTVRARDNQIDPSAAWELSPNSTCAQMRAVTCGAPPAINNVVWPASCTNASLDTNCIGACPNGTAASGGRLPSASCLITGAWGPISSSCVPPGNFSFIGCFTDQFCITSRNPSLSGLTGPVLGSTPSVATCLAAAQASLASTGVLGVRTSLSGSSECFFGLSAEQVQNQKPIVYIVKSAAFLGGTDFTMIALSECSRLCPVDGLACGFNSMAPAINDACTFALYSVARDNTTNSGRRLAAASDAASFDTTAELIDSPDGAPAPEAKALPDWPEVDDDGHRHTMHVPHLRAQIVVDSKPLHVLGMRVVDADVEGGVPRLIECLSGGTFVTLASVNVAPATSTAAGTDEAAAWLRHAASAALAGLGEALSSAGALYVSPMQSTGASNRAQQMLSIKSVMQQNYARLFRVPECVSASYSLWHYMMHQFEAAGGSDTMFAATGTSLLNNLHIDLTIGAVGRPDGQPASSNNADVDCQTALVGSRVRVQLYSSLHGIFRASDVARDVSLWAFAAGPAGDGACMEVPTLSAAR